MKLTACESYHKIEKYFTAQVTGVIWPLYLYAYTPYFKTMLSSGYSATVKEY